MASAEQVKSLLRSYSEGNSEHFASVALQIAADAARQGKTNLAQELRELVDEIKVKIQTGKVGNSVPIARPKGELSSLLAVTYPHARMAEMVLNKEVQDQLQRILKEYRNQPRLREHGLSARRKLLLIGSPGCGKTMTAAVLAGELKLPLFTVQLHGLLTKFMGESAAKLHLIFESMRQTVGVYFFDEFDAIGSHRNSSNDIGEIRRILNSFLQFLELDDSDSLIVAATNYEQLLDTALYRRFDDLIHYQIPDSVQIEELIRNRLQVFLTPKPKWAKLKTTAAGLSHAEIVRACNDAAKDSILLGEAHINSDQLIKVLADRQRLKKLTGI